MTNLSLAVVIISFFVIGLVFMVQSIIRRDESDASFWFTMICISNSLWAICSALFYLLPNESVAFLFYNMRLAFICATSINAYFFTFKSLNHRMINTKTAISYYIFPIITLCIALINHKTGLINMNESIYYNEGIRTDSPNFGIWFYVHFIVSTAFLFLAAKLMVKQRRRLPKNFKAPISIMLLGMTLILTTTILSMLNVVVIRFDPSVVISQITQMFFYLALFKSKSLDMLFTSRDIIFEESQNFILILDNNSQIMDYNKAVRDIATQINIKNLYKYPYEDFINEWKIKFSAKAFKDDPSIFTYLKDGVDVHCQISRTNITNSKQVAIGSYVEIKNIGALMSLIHKLQDYAYYDNLTGLLNRHSFEISINELDCEASLPIGIVSADVNLLKKVNDNLGHSQGDLLLQKVTDIILAKSPEKSIWARTGGDEFVGVIPNTTEKEMEELIKSIENECVELQNEDFLGADLAIAFALKTDISQKFSDLQRQSDIEMYSKKRNRRS